MMKIVTSDSRTTQPLFRINNPGIASEQYALEGRVRSDRVPGEGYLELLSTFPSGETFFSRTMSASGPSAKLIGKFGWRIFSLPFRMSPNSAPPTTLTFGVRAPEGTVIYLSDIQLVEGSAADGAWLTGKELGLAGGIFGAVVGCLGAIMGILSSRGKGRRFVEWIINGVLLVSALLLVTGALSLVYAQPVFLRTSFLLGGGFLALIFVSVRDTVHRRYQDIELRKMEAQDAP